MEEIANDITNIVNPRRDRTDKDSSRDDNVHGGNIERKVASAEESNQQVDHAEMSEASGVQAEFSGQAENAECEVSEAQRNLSMLPERMVTEEQPPPRVPTSVDQMTPNTPTPSAIKNEASTPPEVDFRMERIRRSSNLPRGIIELFHDPQTGVALDATFPIDDPRRDLPSHWATRLCPGTPCAVMFPRRNQLVGPLAVRALQYDWDSTKTTLKLTVIDLVNPRGLFSIDVMKRVDGKNELLDWAVFRAVEGVEQWEVLEKQNEEKLDIGEYLKVLKEKAFAKRDVGPLIEAFEKQLPLMGWSRKM